MISNKNSNYPNSGLGGLSFLMANFDWIRKILWQENRRF